LGVSRFFFIDNDSSDGSSEYLREQGDVRVFHTAGGFREARDGTAWINALLGEFGIGVWCLVVDVDELLIFPGSESVSLPALTAFLDRHGREAVFCLLLDCYPAGRLCDCSFLAGDSLLDVAPYFDVSPYQRTPIEHCPGVLVKGGMRERVFYPEYRMRGLGSKLFDAMLYRVLLRLPLVRDVSVVQGWRRPTPPCLTKVPLVRWRRESRFLHSTHWIAPQPVAQETGVLLHFKFLGDFHARAVGEVERDQHWDGSTEYRRYARRLNSNPDMTLIGAESTRFEDSAQLVRLGLMQDTSGWAGERTRLGAAAVLPSPR
jgi:hypothetical protein